MLNGSGIFRMWGMLLILLVEMLAGGITGAGARGRGTADTCFSGITKSNEEVVKVITQTGDAAQDGEAGYSYSVIYGNGRCKELDDAFTPDATEVFTADVSSISSEVIDGRVTNTLKSTYVKNSQGRWIEADNTVASIMQRVAQQIDHSIWKMKIFRGGDTYFVEVQLNVNLWDPCELYQCDTESGELKLLYTWDDAEIVGIALP